MTKRCSLSVLLLVAALVACEAQRPLRFAVTFDDARGIEAGDEVLYKGLEIGRVLDVGVDDAGKVRVAAIVEGRYRTAIAESSVIEIERSGLLGRRLTVRDGAGERVLLEDGGVLAGSAGQTTMVLERMRLAGSAALEKAQGLAGELRVKMSELGGSPEADELAAALERWREEGPEVAREKLEALRRKVESGAESDEARELVEKLELWFEELEAAADAPAAETPAAEQER